MALGRSKEFFLNKRYDFDWREPNYRKVYQSRFAALRAIEECSEAELEAIKAYYRDKPGGIADFIEDWGMTFDPRAVEEGRQSVMPMVLFQRQREYVEFVMDRWKAKKPGLVEKSRDGGISWVSIGIGCALCSLYEGIVIGYGSRKTEYVDKADAPKALFWKARFFQRHIPLRLRAGWREEIDAPFMRMKFPETGSFMNGEAGDDIGRGDRAAIYFFDEAAHAARAMKIEAALSQTTNCRIDVSSVNGPPPNVFARKRFSGKIEVFVFDWRDDPRKDQEWYDGQAAVLDPVVLAQEVDRDYNAAVEGTLIPQDWVKAAFNAFEVLGIAPSGEKVLGFDVADGGKDKNAVAGGQGVEISICEEWSGKGSDIFASTERVFTIAQEHGIRRVRYDGDGLGAGVKGDSRQINQRRHREGKPAISFEIYRGSDEVMDPDGEDVPGRKNIDYFANRKAQEWWRLRTRFLKTWRWVTSVQKNKNDPNHPVLRCEPHEIISIRTAGINDVQQLAAELSQPTFKSREDGKIIVDKAPGDSKTERMPSPNKADAVVIRFAMGVTPTMPKITTNLLNRAKAFKRPGYR